MTRLRNFSCSGLLLLSVALQAQDMVQIPAGEFTMGRTKLTPDDKTTMRPIVLLDDRPDHKVYLDAYQLDRTEVTHRQYEEFVKATQRKPPYHWLEGKMPAESADHPIYSVDWEDASAYCAFRGKRLPTEAEWERAARGGKEGLSYPWGDKADSKLARYNSQAGPGPVGKYPPNEFGLFDMAGSVSEWCADWFAREYYKTSPAKNPKGPETGSYKVIRGGAWSDSPARITVFFRNWVRPNQKTPNLGFRCAK
ncbi:MAG: formylglycine-generating enzyme family protein [Bryobacterales bacterium]|nr:formylglycine-generating enzyme family protein [Bryobacterales bacterium]